MNSYEKIYNRIVEALSPASKQYLGVRRGERPEQNADNPDAPSQASVYQAIPQSPRRFVQRLNRSKKGPSDPYQGVAGRTAINIRRIKAKKPAAETADFNEKNKEYERGRKTGEYGPNSTMVRKGKIPRNYH
mgnify:CR=1 FL=1